MGEDFTNLLSHISGQSTNKQIQELGMILTRTLEIVISAVDMLEQNLNNMNAALDQRISSIEQKLSKMSGETYPAPGQQAPIARPAVEAKKHVTEEVIEEEELPPEAPVYSPPPTSAAPATAQPQAQGPPGSGVPQQAPQTPPRPMNPINIKQALNSELKQLFTKMRSQSE